jgi:NAD(P)-dependent dehydrogenase (short-subunit alcohol dehydrogenase family)
MSPALRTVVVTGGTGALGCAVVGAFLAAGDRVVVPWMVKAECDALGAERKAAAAEGRLVLVEADVAEESGAATLARAAGEAEVLVNGVGGFAGGQGVEATGLEVWDRMYRLNLRSAAAVTRALLPAMRRRRRGVIVSIASRAAVERPAGLAAYAAAKAGVLVLTDVLQREVEGDGVRVCALLPSTIDTPANRAAMPDADFSRWTSPAQIADVLVWLASDAAAPLRGAVIPV